MSESFSMLATFSPFFSTINVNKNCKVLSSLHKDGASRLSAFSLTISLNAPQLTTHLSGRNREKSITQPSSEYKIILTCEQ